MIDTPALRVDDDGRITYKVADGWYLFEICGNKSHYFKDGKTLCGYQSGGYYPPALYTDTKGYDMPHKCDDDFFKCAKCRRALAKK